MAQVVDVMSTTLFTRAGTPSSNSRRYTSTDTVIDLAANGVLTSSAGSGVFSLTATSVTGPSEIVCARFQTDPLAADVTISSTFSWNLWGLESSMNANSSFKVSLWRIRPYSSGTLIGSSSSTSEFGTSSALRTGSFTPTSTLCLAGDTLGIVISFVDAGGTMGNGFTLTFRTDGSSGGADGDSFVTFTENLTFDTTAPSSTVLWFTDNAASVDVGGLFLEKELQVGGSAPSSFTKVTNTFNGPGSSLITDGAGGTELVWFTPPLDGATIAAGIWNISLDFFESAAAANAAARLEMYLTPEDGSGSNLICLLYMNASGVGNVEMTTASGDAAIVYPHAMESLVITRGQRIKVWIFIQDTLSAVPASFGSVAVTNNMASGQTVTAQFGSGGFIQLPSPLSAYIPQPPVLSWPSQAVHRSRNW